MLHVTGVSRCIFYLTQSFNCMLRIPVNKHPIVFKRFASSAVESADLSARAFPKKRIRPSLKSELNKGPSFEDFIKGTAKDFNPEDPLQQGRSEELQKLPKWLKVPIPKGKSFSTLKKDVRELKLATVCEEAKCPNIGECWGGGGKNLDSSTGEIDRSKATATIMLMGDTCTRGCRFCSVKTSRNPGALDENEPENVAEAVSRWGVGYIVLTTVDRDDLADGGARHLSQTIEKIKQKRPLMLVECLSGDFMGDLAAVGQLADSGLEVYSHNLETVEALTPFVRDRRAKYRQSLAVLEHAKKAKPSILTKTSLMLGLGETDEQILQTLTDLRAVGCDIVTFGQYMRPTKRHMKVVEYVQPEKFDHWKKVAEEQFGFEYCASGPLVRSSYKAGEYYIENLYKKKQQAAESAGTI